MSRFFKLLGIVLVLFLQQPNLQAQLADSSNFFTDEHPIEVNLSSDFKTLLAKREQRKYQPAVITMKFPDSTSITETIRLQARGEFRMKNCYMPSVMLNFKNPTSPRLRPLKKLKLVCGCGTNADDEQLIIKEYLVYKMYNLLTPMSFRVRLLHINFEDTKGKVKKYSQYGFLIEDVDEMADRNNCTEVEKIAFNTESTDRDQMTLVALFQYMIGNTDWAVPNYHNIKLLRLKEDTLSLPYTIPYDFDYCGLVDASYAVPPEELGIKTVRERSYRGFQRNIDELEAVFANFRKQKEKMYALVNNCPWLSNKYKKETINYLDEYFKMINSKKSVEYNFIDNARTN